jgi:hypothetical protein
MFIGYTIKRAGVVIVIVALALAVVVLSTTLVLVQINTAAIAPKLADRWTGTDQAAYVKEHDENVARLLAKEKGLVNDSMGEIKIDVQAIREQLAGDGARLKNIEKQLDRIETKVFNGYKRGEG